MRSPFFLPFKETHGRRRPARRESALSRFKASQESMPPTPTGAETPVEDELPEEFQLPESWTGLGSYIALTFVFPFHILFEQLVSKHSRW